jgi:ligand-binding SRPBCC domain-containing protein
VPARRTFTLHRTQVVVAPLDEAWAFYADPENLEAITPPWLRFRSASTPPALHAGSLLRHRLRILGVPVSWLTLIETWLPPRTFVDVQLAGPYRLWRHTHRLSTVRGGTEIHDHVEYRIPGGPLAPLADAVVRRLLRAIFDYRAARTAELLGGGPSTS